MTYPPLVMRNLLVLAFGIGILLGLAPRDAAFAQLAGTGDFHIQWEVKNRFRLFKNEADFQRIAAENRGGYRRVGLRLAISGDYDGIIKLLAAIETAAPPLVLSNVQFHGVLRPTAQAQSSRLDAGLEVYGFRRTDAPVAVKQ